MLDSDDKLSRLGMASVQLLMEPMRIREGRPPQRQYSKKYWNEPFDVEVKINLEGEVVDVTYNRKTLIYR